jgi:hypothetical protein
VAGHRLEIVGHENTTMVRRDPKYIRVANAFQLRDIRAEEINRGFSPEAAGHNSMMEARVRKKTD